MSVSREQVDAAAKLLAGLEPATLERTLAQVRLRIANDTPVDELLPIPVSMLGEYLEMQLPVPPRLISPALVVRGELHVTMGRSGKGKTSLNLHRLMRWSAGLPMFDGLTEILAPVEGPIKTLIIENEGNGGMFQERVGKMFASDFMPTDAKVQARENLMIWKDGGYSGLKIDSSADLDLLHRAAEKYQPDLIFIEPFRGLWSGNENDSTEMARVVDNFVSLATDHGLAVIIAHHERKSGAGDDGERMSAARGSGALEGVVATMEHIEPVKAGEQRELDWSKVRYDDWPAPIRMQWDPAKRTYDYVPAAAGSQDILKALAGNDGEPMSIKELREETDEQDHRVRKLLKELTNDGRVKRLPSVSIPGGGTSGNLYRLAGNVGEDATGLEIG